MSALVAIPTIWVMTTYLDGDAWWMVIAHPLLGLIAMMLIVFLSTIVLTRRQALLDAGKTPFFERIERHKELADPIGDGVCNDTI